MAHQGEVTATMKVQATMGGALSKQTQEVLKRHRGGDGGLTKVVELGGRTVIVGGGKSKEGCPFEEKCWIKEGQVCTRARTVYEVRCSKCTAVYTGTTGHSVHKRGWEHMRALKGNNMTYAITKHFSLDHPEVDRNEERLFEMRIIDKTRTSNLERYISEGIKIEEANLARGGGKQLNSKGEWGRVSIKRLTVTE